MLEEVHCFTYLSSLKLQSRGFFSLSFDYPRANAPFLSYNVSGVLGLIFSFFFSDECWDVMVANLRPPEEKGRIIDDNELINT